MGLGSKLKKAIGEERINDWQQQLHDVVENGLERHLRIAVTGLSRSGKTVFISSLTHHLLQAHQSQSLPFLNAVNEGRIISVKNISDDTDHPFPLQRSIEKLQLDPPEWPPSSTGLSTIRLAIRYKPKNRFKQLVSEASTLYLDLIDYPGEWLLDLPLLQLSYRDWCTRQMDILQHSARVDIAQDWLDEVHSIDWLQPVTQETLDQLNTGYKALLEKFRQQGFSLLQPGRLVLSDSDDEVVLFPTPVATTEAGSGESGYATLETHYQRYITQLVRPFYRQHFSRFDRQIVLIDCLKTLNLGKPCYDDMQLALHTVLESFHYGQNSLLRRIFKPRIDKVLFAATKADHVTANQHYNLDRFLQLMIDQAQRELRFDGIETLCLALASIRSTQSASAKMNGQQLSCLKGVNKANNEEVALFPGEVPVELPNPRDWNQQRFRFIDFAPQRLPQKQLTSEHHIRLDQALEFLMGDYL